jgi:hypothetical protein
VSADGHPGIAKDRGGSQHSGYPAELGSSLLVHLLHILEEFGVRIQANLAHNTSKNVHSRLPRTLPPHPDVISEVEPSDELVFFLTYTDQGILQ